MAKINQAGFTLIELMVTVVVTSILAATAIPSFSKMIKDGRTMSVYNGLVSELSYARSEAVKRSDNVSVCARATDSSCATSTSDWSEGWLVYVEINNNNTLDANETVLRVNQKLQDQLELKAHGFTNTSVITYRPRGNTSSPGYFTVCDDRGNEHAKAVNLLITGAVRKAVDADNNNVVENMSGTDISCS